MVKTDEKKVEVEAVNPDRAEPDREPKKNTAIYKTINDVSIAIEEVKKTGYSSQHKQSYLSAQDLMTALKPHMNDKGLVIHEDKLENEELKAFTSNGRQQYCYSATYIFKLTHVHSGEFILVPAKGVGFDFGDKACYKASTLALKYALQHIFFVVTKDDPEADNEHAPAPASTKAPTAADKAKDARDNAPMKNDPSLISLAQGKRFYAMYKGANKTPEMVKKHLIQQYGIESTTAIKKEWYEDLCKWAEAPTADNDAPANDPNSDIPF